MRWDDKDSFLYSPQIGLLWAHFLIRSQSWSFSICCCSVAKSCLTVWDPMDCNMLGFPVFTISWSLLKFLSIELVMPSNHLILCHPLLLLPSIFPSIKVFSNESALRIKWSKYWSFSFTISPSDEYSGLISFRVDWFDLLAVQETLKSLLQHHSKPFWFKSVWSGFSITYSWNHPKWYSGKENLSSTAFHWCRKKKTEMTKSLLFLLYNCGSQRRQSFQTLGCAKVVAEVWVRP